MRDGVPLPNDDDDELSWECWVWRREHSMWLFRPDSWLRVRTLTLTQIAALTLTLTQIATLTLTLTQIATRSQP